MRLLVFPTFIWILTAAAFADGPSTRPAEEEQWAVRQQMVDWNKQGPGMTQAEFRRLFHAEDGREEKYTDQVASLCWESSKLQKAVRDKWGVDTETQFAHLVGTDTEADDRASGVQIEGDRALITWAVKDIEPTKLVKVNGHWLFDMHAMFADWLKDNRNLEQDRQSETKALAVAREDIASGKFDSKDSFMRDFKEKWTGN